MSKSKTRTYKINGEVYELMRPVFGVLRDISFFCREAGDSVKTTQDLKQFLRDKTGQFVARLVTPKGVHPADRDFNAMARAIDWDAGPELSAEVLDDFFGQPGMETPDKMLMVGSATNMLAGMILPTKIAREIQAAGMKDSKPLSDTSQNSPEAIPSSESKSSGDSGTPT